MSELGAAGSVEAEMIDAATAPETAGEFQDGCCSRTLVAEDVIPLPGSGSQEFGALAGAREADSAAGGKCR